MARPQPESVPGRHVEGENAARRSPGAGEPDRGCFFFFNDTATTEIYTLSLHDAFPISGPLVAAQRREVGIDAPLLGSRGAVLGQRDRKSTRLNSSHVEISYAVFCL